MNNNDYHEALKERLAKLQELRIEAIKYGGGIIGGTLLLEDLFFTSALDRSVALLDGIVEMLKNRNLSCTGILVRSQIDNCLRIFAAFIAEDKTSLIKGYIDGKQISDFKDNRGKKMKDVTLRERLESFDPQVSTVYKKSSGYIHLSNVAFNSSVWTTENNHIEFSVGIPIREEANEILLEGADVFIHYTLLEFKFLQAVVESKGRVDSLNSSEAEYNDCGF